MFYGFYPQVWLSRTINSSVPRPERQPGVALDFQGKVDSSMTRIALYGQTKDATLAKV